LTGATELAMAAATKRQKMKRTFILDEIGDVLS